LCVEPLQRLAPPRQPYRAKRRLGRRRHDFAKRIVDAEQRIEGGPELDRPVQPDEIAVRQFSDS
jgi:hypothetical protein